MTFLFRKISYKVSFLIFVVFVLLATTAVNLTMKLKSDHLSQDQNKKIVQLKQQINKLNKDTPPLEESKDFESSSTNTGSSNSGSGTSTNNDSGSTNLPTSTPPPSQPPTFPPSSSPPPPTSPKTVTVAISSGVVYSNLNPTINSGDTIKWVNNDSLTCWPASNPHPLHTDYPGFDSGGISPGSSWSFKFDNKGNWGWHDHTRPSITGTITVL